MLPVLLISGEFRFSPASSLFSGSTYFLGVNASIFCIMFLTPFIISSISVFNCASSISLIQKSPQYEFKIILQNVSLFLFGDLSDFSYHGYVDNFCIDSHEVEFIFYK